MEKVIAFGPSSWNSQEKVVSGQRRKVLPWSSAPMREPVVMVDGPHQSKSGRRAVEERQDRVVRVRVRVWGWVGWGRVGYSDDDMH